MTIKERGKKTEQAIERLLKKAQMARDMTTRKEGKPPFALNEKKNRGLVMVCCFLCNGSGRRLFYIYMIGSC